MRDVDRDRNIASERKGERRGDRALQGIPNLVMAIIND